MQTELLRLLQEPFVGQFVVERAVQALRDAGTPVDEALLGHLSPLGWEHINLTGDYIWRQSKQVEQGELRPLRVRAEA